MQDSFGGWTTRWLRLAGSILRARAAGGGTGWVTKLMMALEVKSVRGCWSYGCCNEGEGFECCC